MISQKHEFNISLTTPNGETQSSVGILYVGEEDEDPIKVTACIKYDGKEYCGNGTNYLWLDAIADLQNKLPYGVKLKSCVVCKHGSLCPVGNIANEVFCVKDIIPKQKSDLFFYTEDYKERERRSRKYFELCEDFAPQNDDYYTYNDFLHFLKNDL